MFNAAWQQCLAMLCLTLLSCKLTIGLMFMCKQGWWDQHWLGCPNLDTFKNASAYMDSISTVIALHTRYPDKDAHL